MELQKEVEKKTAEIDLKEDAVYAVINGELEPIERPKSGFGKQVINWKDGKIAYLEVSYTKKK